MMRRIILLLMALAMTLVVASGVALAVNKKGTDGPNTLWGTNSADNLFGMGGNDKLYAMRGNDNLLGGPGSDFVVGGTREGGLGTEYPVGGNKNLFGGSGNDTVFGGKGSDNISGGPGNDFLLDAGFFKWGNLCCPAGDNVSGGTGQGRNNRLQLPQDIGEGHSLVRRRLRPGIGQQKRRGCTRLREEVHRPKGCGGILRILRIGRI